MHWSIAISLLQILGILLLVLFPKSLPWLALALQITHVNCLRYYKPERSWADQVTLIRGFIAVAAAFLALRLAEMDWLLWSLFSLALLLDGLDGYLARRQQTATESGAIFDMETDGIWVSLMCWTLMALGLMPLWGIILAAWRPFYCIVSLFLPKIKTHPKGSWFGKTVFVLVGVVLLMIASPLRTMFFPAQILTLACILLSFSFLRSLLAHLKA